jgi:hypothetical protein
MAEEKKPAGAGNKTNSDYAGQAVFLVVGLFFLAALAPRFLNYLKGFEYLTYSSILAQAAAYFREHIWPVWKQIAVGLSVLALAGIIYNSRKRQEIEAEEQKIYGATKDISTETSPTKEESGNKEAQPNEKWQKILDYANSDNVSDWRLSIIEADVMLEEVLRASGHVGESVGEMLKSADKNDFLTLDDAWEGHKIRNRIAHSGADFQLNERETKRALALFEKVFKEFKVI